MIREIKFISYEKSMPELLDSLNFDAIIKRENKIILKPNLTCCKEFPTTTYPKFVEEIIKHIRKHNKEVEIIIAEGSGGDPTDKCFKELGYEALSDNYGIPLINLNTAETLRLENSEFKKFSFIDYPKILLDGFLISLPVLKEHIEATVTISLKNMLGCYPSAQDGKNWKTEMHQWHIDYSIHDIVVCRYPDFAICDASVGQLKNEVSGTPKEFGILLAGDPLGLDKRGAFILGHDWEKIRHLVFIDEYLKSKSR